jgi:polypeptide N-acetylgalactosaminyltransferase
MNRNEFKPVKGAGDQGLPVLIPSHQHSKMNALFRINQFNLLASDRIPLNRSLPDIRKKK